MIRSNANNSKSANNQFLISCPSCKQQFELTEAVRAQITTRLDAEISDQIEEARRQERANVEKQLKDAKQKQDGELTSLRDRLQEMEKRELAALQAERRLADKELQIQIEAEKALQKERDAIRHAVETNLTTRHQRALEERETVLADLKKQLQQSEDAQRRLLLTQSELERRERGLELEVEKRLATARPELMKQAREALQAESRLQLEARELEVQRLKAEVAKLSETARMSGLSAEVSGESLEQLLKEILLAVCPTDKIAEVQRGQYGADIIQTVLTSTQVEAGTIVWEAKCTAKWSDTWISKTKTAQQKSNAEISVIVTKAMPREVDGPFGLHQGVWVVHVDAASAVAVTLRHMLLRLYSARLVSEARDARFQMLQEYLLSPAFRLQCEAVVQAVRSMQNQLDSEQRTLTRAWASRQKHLQALGNHVATMVGSIEGSLGSDDLLPHKICDVESLEMEAK